MWSSGTCTGTTSITNATILGLTLPAPPQVKTTGNFIYTLNTVGGDNIATGSVAILQSTIQTGIINTFIFQYVSSASQIIQEATEWKIGFTIQSPLANPWVITVTYPNSEFTIASCTPTNLIGFLAGTTCSVASNTLTIQGSYVLPAGTVSFENVTGTNPVSVFTIGAFTVNSFNTLASTNYAVDVYDSADTSFTNPFTPIPQTLTDIAISINTPATYSFSGLSNVPYDFVITHKSSLLLGYQVKVTIPASNCLTMVDGTSTSVSSYIIPNAITADKDNSTTLNFSYTGFTNPRSTNAA